MNYIKRSDDTRTFYDKFILIDDIKRLSEYIVENQMTEESLTYDYGDFHKTFKGFFDLIKVIVLRLHIGLHIGVHFN